MSGSRPARENRRGRPGEREKYEKEKNSRLASFFPDFISGENGKDDRDRFVQLGRDGVAGGDPQELMGQVFIPDNRDSETSCKEDNRSRDFSLAADQHERGLVDPRKIPKRDRELSSCPGCVFIPGIDPA